MRLGIGLRRYGLIGLVAVMAGAANFACTRNFKGESTIRLSSAGVGSLGAPTGTLVHIAVNVRGSDMGVKTWSWDAHDGGSGSVTVPPPSVISLDVPAGSSRLIQYLGVFKDKTNPSLPIQQFTYGSIVQDLQPGAQDVYIDATIINSAGSRDGRVAGQYMLFDGVNSGVNVFGPTGRFMEEFSAVPTDPPMVVGYGEMFNGWFQGFGMDGVPIRYRFIDGGQLMTFDAGGRNPIDLTGALTLPAMDTLMKVRIPFAFKRYNMGGGTPQNEDPLDLVVGFFGPSLGSVTVPRQVHYMPSPFPISGISLVSGSSTVPMRWNTSGEIEVSGGYIGGASGTEMLERIEFDPARFSNGGHDALGWEGPFVKFAGNVSLAPCFGGGSGGSVLSCYAEYGGVSITPDLKLQWQYIPGVTVTNGFVRGVEGTSIFIFNFALCGSGSGGGDCYERFRPSKEEDGVNCSGMAALGAIPLGDFSGAMTVATFIDKPLEPGQYGVFLCPYRSRPDGSKEYFTSAGRGWFQVQAPNLPLVGVGGGPDASFDMIFTAGNASIGPLVSLNSYTGAATYRAKVVDNASGMTTYCGPYVGTVPAGGGTLPTGACAIPLSDGQQYRVAVDALNSSGAVIAHGEQTFLRALNMPSFNFTSYSCVNDGAGHLNLIVNFAVFNYANIAALHWIGAVNANGFSYDLNPYIYSFNPSSWGFVDASLSFFNGHVINPGTMTVQTTYANGYSFNVPLPSTTFTAGTGCP